MIANIAKIIYLQSAFIFYSEFKKQVPFKTCEACSGSGICSECKGEGFVLKRLSDGNAEKARLSAKNAATRYTAGYITLLCFSSLCLCVLFCSHIYKIL